MLLGAFMRKTIGTIISIIIIISLIILTIIFGNFNFSEKMLKTLNILIIICGISILYCFVVGEITRNNSQMDKLWSILPIVYAWVITGFSGFKVRLILASVAITIWGIRLTFNFARKGAYKLKFWKGEEDYRWKVLRSKKPFTNKFIWALFDLFFISIYQNILVLAITLPLLASIDSSSALNYIDLATILLAVFFLSIEYFADEEQWYFHETKKAKLQDGKILEELEYPFNLGFNTLGIWGRMRHPNYLGEQGFWLSLYITAIAAGVCNYYVLNWSLIAPLALILLFMGSSTMSEAISSSKYPKYKLYQQQVFKYLPFRKFKDEE